ncbi:S-adenosyl-L-methionine-dependent methyltransferase [Aspergillus egyptiacus]|nr:S-adenosyl-L-methionine-dependent methyltransferase [Aspergillus egyptiacus]
MPPTSTWTEKNRQVFDNQSTTYKTDFAKVIQTLTRTILERRLWISNRWTDTYPASNPKAGTENETGDINNSNHIKMLEYACGPGHISLALSPFVNRIIGLDVSDGMISEFRKNVLAAGLSDDTVTAVKADLLSEDPPPSSSSEVSGPEYFDFDIVVVSMAVHHFENPALAVRRLGERVKSGGVLVVVDLVPEEGDHGHGHGHGLENMGEVAGTISKHGFGFEEVREMFSDAGVGERFEYEVVEEPLVFEKEGNVFEKTIFIARGLKG